MSIAWSKTRFITLRKWKQGSLEYSPESFYKMNSNPILPEGSISTSSFLVSIEARAGKYKNLLSNIDRPWIHEWCLEVEISSNFQSSSSPSYNRQRLVELRAFSSSLYRYRKALHIKNQMRHKWYFDAKKILFTPHIIIRIALSNCKINGLLVDLGIILCLI